MNALDISILKFYGADVPPQTLVKSILWGVQSATNTRITYFTEKGINYVAMLPNRKNFKPALTGLDRWLTYQNEREAELKLLKNLLRLEYVKKNKKSEYSIDFLRCGDYLLKHFGQRHRLFQIQKTYKV